MAQRAPIPTDGSLPYNLSASWLVYLLACVLQSLVCIRSKLFSTILNVRVIIIAVFWISNLTLYFSSVFFTVTLRLQCYIFVHILHKNSHTLCTFLFMVMSITIDKRVCWVQTLAPGSSSLTWPHAAILLPWCGLVGFTMNKEGLGKCVLGMF